MTIKINFIITLMALCMCVMSSTMTSFGHKAKQQHFMLKDDITFLNHGSYGAVPRSVFEFRLR